jgi:hypothetical protein
MPTEFISPPTPNDRQRIVARYHNFFGGSLSASFQVHARIEDVNIRYRQYIKGFYLYDNIVQEHQLEDGSLNKSTFLEDKQNGVEYGNRDKNTPRLSVYRREGDHYIFTSEDTPQDYLNCPPGTTVHIHLTFKGILCDKDAVIDPNSNIPNPAVLATRLWMVTGSYKVES